MHDKPLSDPETYSAANVMPAIVMTDFPVIGRVADELRMVDVPVPRPKSGEVAIKLAASSMHIDEIYAAQGTCLGRFFGPKRVSEAQPYIMGSSVSGNVVAVGNTVTDVALGDDVIVIPDETGEIGSWARYRCVAANMVMPKPGALSHVEAAAVTMASCVAWGAIERGGIGRGDRCLVVGASGAVGIVMVQILHSMGAVVTGVCSGGNAGFVRKHGATDIIDYTAIDFGDAGPDSFDVVFDAIGGRETEQNAARVLPRHGRFVTVVGPQRYIGEEKLSWYALSRIIGHILWRSIASRFDGPRYIFGEKLPRKTIRSAMDHVRRHGIRMPVEAEIPFQLAQVKEAVRLLATHRAKGRIVINFQRPTIAPLDHAPITRLAGEAIDTVQHSSERQDQHVHE